jgi:hypothetical protein
MADPVMDMLRGLAATLGAAGVGDWSPGAVSAADWPITLISTPPNAAKSITLTQYASARAPSLVNVLTSVNVRIRGDSTPATCSDKAAEVYQVLQGLRGALPNGARVTQVFMASETQIGPDQSGRYERSVNYYVQHDVQHAGAT